MAVPTHGGKNVGTNGSHSMTGQHRKRWRRSRSLLSLVALLVGATTRTSFAHGLLLSMVATEKIPIRPVWFSSQGCNRNHPPSPSLLQNRSPLVIFIHGRLEAEEDEPPFDAPAKLYEDFCRGLAGAMRPHEETPEESPSVLLLEYDELLSKELPREPRNFSYGPVSTALAEAISTHVLVPSKADAENHSKEQQQQEPRQTLVLVSFSMGAAMALKLLKNSNALTESLTHVVLIEPVWRCWLPFCVSSPSPILPERDSPRVLALFGTHDDQTHVDSGGSVRGALRPFLPDLEVVALKGGNHWGILSEAVAGDIAREGLAATEAEARITPQLLQTKMIHEIASFCGWDSEE